MKPSTHRANAAMMRAHCAARMARKMNIARRRLGKLIKVTAPDQEPVTTEQAVIEQAAPCG
jgi:peptide subunit release factor RF-3